MITYMQVEVTVELHQRTLNGVFPRVAGPGGSGLNQDRTRLTTHTGRARVFVHVYDIRTRGLRACGV